MHTFWAAHCLARAGHEVHLVTNAGEAPDNYKHVMLRADVEFLGGQPSGLRIHSTSTVPHGAFIPFAQPYASKLLGLAHSLSSQRPFDAYIGWYLEPYGLVASILGRLQGSSVFLRHAGSDLGRLLDEPDLRSAAILALSRPTRIVTMPSHRDTFASLGVPPERMLYMRSPRLPDYHTAAEAVFMVDQYRQEFPRWLSRAVGDRNLVERFESADSWSHEQHRPRIGIYGKVGRSKGSFALLRALADERIVKLPFQFFSVPCGHSVIIKEFLSTLVGHEALLQKTVCLPPLPPWRIPGFLRSLNVVFCLENRFPITFHSPILVREVLASGACLVCSRELVQKLPFQSSLVPGRNVIIVDDPEDHEQLVRIVAEILEDADKAASIGKHGRFLSEFVEGSMLQEHPMVRMVE